MSSHVPTYTEQGKTYYCDTCVPVVEAVKAGTLQLETVVHGSYPGRPLPETALQGVKSLGFWNSTMKQNWGLDWHRNEGIEFTMLSNGELPFSVENRDYLLEPDDLTITRPWQLHKVGNPYIGINKLYVFILDVGVRKPHQEWKWPSWIVLRKEDLDELTIMLRQNEQHVWKASPEVRQCLVEIGQAVKNGKYENTISKLTIYVNEFLLHLLEMFRTCSPSLNESLTSAQRSVKMFLCDLKDNIMERWTVHSMAEECRIGVTSFVFYCKQLTNMTPMQYLTHLRVESASALLLRKPYLNIIDIALDCGFSSSQYFASCFKKFTGSTPSEYRRKFENGRVGNELPFTAAHVG